VGAGGRDRTDDLPLTKRLLYQLSYAGMVSPIIAIIQTDVKDTVLLLYTCSPLRFFV
jgi:hypothetical protein